jgi:hypothetical protein
MLSVSFNALDTKSFIFDFKLSVKLESIPSEKFNSIANTLTDGVVIIARMLNPMIILEGSENIITYSRDPHLLFYVILMVSSLFSQLFSIFQKMYHNNVPLKKVNAEIDYFVVYQ